MPQAPRFHHHSIRLPGYDYTLPGAYFITICLADKICWFGDVISGEMELSDLGEIARKEWERLPKRFENLRLDQFCIMPNHMHGIVWVDVGDQEAARGEAFSQPVSGSIPTVVRSYKASVSLRCKHIRPLTEQKLWQPGYYEHILRNDQDLRRVQEYILLNPLRWDIDSLRPDR